MYTVARPSPSASGRPQGNKGFSLIRWHVALRLAFPDSRAYVALPVWFVGRLPKLSREPRKYICLWDLKWFLRVGGIHLALCLIWCVAGLSPTLCVLCSITNDEEKVFTLHRCFNFGRKIQDFKALLISSGLDVLLGSCGWDIGCDGGYFY